MTLTYSYYVSYSFSLYPLTLTYSYYVSYSFSLYLYFSFSLFQDFFFYALLGSCRFSPFSKVLSGVNNPLRPLHFHFLQLTFSFLFPLTSTFHSFPSTLPLYRIVPPPFSSVSPAQLSYPP